MLFWHNGINWKKHQALCRLRRKVYQRAGMTEAQIDAMEEFDAEVFRSDRRFYTHNGPYLDSDTPEKTPEPVSPGGDGMPDGVRLGWMEEIGDPALLSLLRSQPPEILRLVDLLVFQGCSQREAARLLGTCPQRICVLWGRFRKEAADRLAGRTAEDDENEEERRGGRG